MDDSDAGSGLGPTEPETRRLRRLQAAMGEADVALGRRLGMRATDLSAMSHLTFADQPLTPSGLSNRLGMTPPAVTELVDRLERAGHLARQRDSIDRRRINLLPTASALAEVHGGLDPLVAAIDQVVRGYSAADRELIERFLDDVITAYTHYGRSTR